MAEWNAYYRGEDDDEEQEEGEQSGGEVKDNGILSYTVSVLFWS